MPVPRIAGLALTPRGRAGVTLAMVAALSLGACSNEGSAEPRSSSNPSTSPSGGQRGRTAAEVTKEVFGEGAQPKVLGSATGTIVRQSSQQTAEILAVETSPNGTYLRWLLKSADGQKQALKWLWGVAPLTEFDPWGDLRAVRLAIADGTYATATTYDRIQRAGKSSSYCLCSAMPQELPADEPVSLYGYYPPLPEGTTTVTVQISGLPDITNVPVTQGAGAGGP